MLNAFPIIQGRTFNSGFPTNPLFCPECLNNEEINVCRKYILASVNYIDNQKGVRRLVFPAGRYVIIGITSLIDELGKLTASFEYEPYSRDKFGRSLFAFIGYCVSIKDIKKSQCIPDISDKELMDLYIKYVSPESVWNDPKVTSHKSVKCCINTKQIIEKPLDRNIFTNCTDELNRNIVDAVISRYAIGMPSSLCTNLQSEYILNDSLFTFMTTTLNKVSVPINTIPADASNNSFPKLIKAAAIAGTAAIATFTVIKLLR